MSKWKNCGEMAFNVSSLGKSVSVVLTYSAEVMVGKDVLMQPRLNSIHTAESNTGAFGAMQAWRVTVTTVADRAEWHKTTQS